MSTVVNPIIPFNGPISGGMFPGRIIRIKGVVPTTADKFAVNLLVGITGDIALHLSPHMHSHHVVRNSVQHMNWGHEEKHGHLPLHHGQPFELIILCDPYHYKIAFNGVHFAEFNHRLPLQTVTNLGIDGQVIVHAISYEGGGVGGFVSQHPPHIPHGVPPYPAPGHVPAGHFPPQGTTPYPAPGAHYPTQGSVPYPTGGHYPPQGAAPYPAGVHYPTQQGGTHYPTQQGGTHYPTAHGHLSPHSQKKTMKKQAKAQKKALKYGLPLGAAAVGAYALHKGMHHHHGHKHHKHSSSSSSSSSD